MLQAICRAGLLASLLIAPVASARAQYVPPNRRAATGAELVGGNMLIGGVTAATRAMFTGKDPLRAFAIGAVGGAVALGGKYLAVEPGTGWAGLALSATGTSIVANAGRGVSPLEEVSVPLPGIRFRVSPRSDRKLRVVLNAYEAVQVVQFVWRGDLLIDWAHTTATGALVFVTDQKHVAIDGTKVDGASDGPIAIVSAFAKDPGATARHEIVHVYQGWFEQEAWGRPVEDYLRSRLTFGDRIPDWFEFGVGAPMLATIEYWMVGRNGTHHLKEAEAGLLERR